MTGSKKMHRNLSKGTSINSVSLKKHQLSDVWPFNKLRVKKMHRLFDAFFWWARWESNPHSFWEHDFESCASTNSAIRPRLRLARNNNQETINVLLHPLSGVEE